MNLCKRMDRKMHVYVVEDDAGINEIECYALKTNGYETGL